MTFEAERMLDQEAARTAPATLSVEGPVATITLDRPAVLNAMNAGMAGALAALALEVERRRDIRVLVVRGQGDNFCAGGDIAGFADHLDDIGPFVRGMLADMHAFLLTLRRMPQLVLTSIQGAAAGAGFSLAFMGDMAIAADSAKFTPAYRMLGVSPDCGGTIGVVRAVGPRRALQIFLAESGFSAPLACQWGLVNVVVPADQLDRETADLAHRIARTPLEAIAATKRLIQQSAATGMAHQLDAELEALLGCMNTASFRQSVLAFKSSARSPS